MDTFKNKMKRKKIMSLTLEFSDKNMIMLLHNKLHKESAIKSQEQTQMTKNHQTTHHRNAIQLR